MLCGHMNKQMVILQAGMWTCHINMLVITEDLGQTHNEAFVIAARLSVEQDVHVCCHGSRINAGQLKLGLLAPHTFCPPV